MQLICRRPVNGLDFAGWPANHGLFNLWILAQPEMYSAIILCGETAAAGNILHLLLPIPEQRDLSADGTAVTGGSFQLKLYPLVPRGHGVFVKQQRPTLVGDNNIQHATIP